MDSAFRRGRTHRSSRRRVYCWLVCAMALLAFPAAANATVSPMLATLETGDFTQFNYGAQTQDSGASITTDTSKSYDGTRSAHASYAGGGGNNYARGVESVQWNDGDDVWYGEAVYLPVGFKASMQGQVDLFRWDDWPSTYQNGGPDPCGTLGGLVMWGSDKQARFVNDHYTGCGGESTLVGPFNIPEGQWVWFDVHQVFSESDGSALTQLYMNGKLVGSSTAANKTASYPIQRIRFGLVAIASGAQTNPLDLWFDRAYVGTPQLRLVREPGNTSAAPTTMISSRQAGTAINQPLTITTIPPTLVR
jgi:Polysaccharide lyase